MIVVGFIGDAWACGVPDGFVPLLVLALHHGFSMLAFGGR